MPRVGNATELTPVPLRALVVNAGTELATAVAVASLRANAPSARILVVDARRTPPVSTVLDDLAATWDFDVLDVPFDAHGPVLDALTETLPDDDMWMLFDSDAELRDATWVDTAAKHLEDPQVFGVGYEWVGDWIGEEYAPLGTCWFRGKHWTGCVMFRANALRAAHAAGISFRISVLHNDIKWSRTLSRFFALRFDTKVLPGGYTRRALRVLPKRLRARYGRAKLPWLRWARRSVEGQRPNLIFDDTGGAIQQWCLAQGWTFVDFGVPPPDDGDLVRTWHPGLTTRMLREGMDAASLVEPERELRTTLRDRYGTNWDDLGAPAWSWPRADAQANPG